MSVSELVNSLNNAELRHNLRSGRGSETALVADFRNRAKLGVGQSRQGVDRFSAMSKTSRQVSGSVQQQL